MGGVWWRSRTWGRRSSIIDGSIIGTTTHPAKLTEVKMTFAVCKNDE